MRAIRLQLSHSPPLVGGIWKHGSCTKRLSSCTSVLWLRKIPANSVSFSTKDCSRIWPMMFLTSPTRAITFRPGAVSPNLNGLKRTWRTSVSRATPAMVALTFAFIFSSAILVISVVVSGALVVLLLYLGKGTHNLLAYSGDTTLLSIASLNSMTTMAAVFSVLSLLINKAILGKLLSLRLIEANKKRIYRLTKHAQAEFG